MGNGVWLLAFGFWATIWATAESEDAGSIPMDSSRGFGREDVFKEDDIL
jgi:hypothetical protein